MSFNAKDHFSYHFELNLEKIPAKCSDRLSLSLLLPGLLFSAFLVVLGFYEALNGLSPENDASLSGIIAPWFSLTLFDIVLVFLGFWTFGKLLFSYFTYKKVFFDGKKITMIYRHALGAKTTVKESLKKYKGVRFRVEFFQFGFINKSKYIVELYHDDADKIAPLYISTDGHNIRKIWQSYAEKLNLPEIIMTENGWVMRQLQDVGKSLTELYKEGLLTDEFKGDKTLPSALSLVKKKDKNVVKIRKRHWDVFNIINLSLVIGIALILAWNRNIFISSLSGLLLFSVLASVLALSFCKLFTKDKLVIKPNKIIIIHKTFFLSRKKSELEKSDIKIIDVALNPANDRYFLLIIGSEKTLVFGRKLPLEDLVWVKQFLIHHIIKK